MATREGQLKISSAWDYSSHDLRRFLDTYQYQAPLTERLDQLARHHLTQTSIMEIVLWKVNRYVEITAQVLDDLFDLVSLERKEHHRGESVLDALLGTRGIDLPMASTLLRFQNPKVFQIIDRRAYRAIYGENYRLYSATSNKRKIQVYFAYLDKLNEFCDKMKVEFDTADRLLYEFDKKENGKL